jgi:ribosomal protein S18 acetylase RimI-like enzyme
MDWALRATTAADDDFLRRVYAGTRADELALTDWSAAQREDFVAMQHRAQTAHYRARWPDARQSVIVVRQGGLAQDAGRLWLHQRADAIHVLDIALLPACRGWGLGTQCLQDLMQQAAASGRAVTIYVEAGNPARRLYNRLGFVPVGPPQGVHQHMAWRPMMTQLKETCDEQT